MILHIASDNTKLIIYPFIKFVTQNFNKNEHFFILCSKDKDIKKFENAITKDIFTQTEFFIQQMKKADKIILHGIWYDKLCEIYEKYPEFFNKTIWDAWGWDYYYERSKLHRWFIENVKFIITDKNSFEIIKKMYNVKGELFFKYLYPSQIFKKYRKEKGKLNILVNHSGDSLNNHLEVLKKLLFFRKKNIKIFLILSYGEENYIKKVKREYKKVFKNKCVVIQKKMNLNKYLKMLAQIDIAIFNHAEQMAKNTKFFLFANQTKIYLNKNDDLIDEFKRIGLNFWINKNISLKKDYLYKNYIKINKEVSKEKLKKHLKSCFLMDLK